MKFTIIATDSGFKRSYHCNTYAKAEFVFKALITISSCVEWWKGATLVQIYTE
jgi:hypothetical protein